MDKFVIRQKPPSLQVNTDAEVETRPPKISRIDGVSNLESDPGLRAQISTYHPNDQDIVRRAYLQKGPFQPKNFKFPQREFGKTLRRFNEDWFTKYGSWLEYSIAKDAAFCLYCYLFKSHVGGGDDAFTVGGFTNWKKLEKLQAHVGGVNSSHNQAYRKCEVLLKQECHIQSFFDRHTEQEKMEYKIRLIASIDCVRFLLRQGLAFRGHDESQGSHNQGNFLELLEYTAGQNEAIKSVVLQNAPNNLKLTSPDIQKDIAEAAAAETINIILEDIGDALFAVLIDESRDISIKEQMAVVLRYVDKRGCVIERFVGVVHVLETTSISLKMAIEALFSKLGLNIMRLRGQGYDGASNMQGASNGLKTLILKENPSAYYIHCFAHQLQLALVHVAKNHNQIALLFNMVSNVVNIVGASCKRRDALRIKQMSRIVELVESGELSSGKGLNQETSMKRPGDTRWGSHYGIIVNLIIMFSSVIEVLELVAEDGQNQEAKGEAFALLGLLQDFDFVLSLHLMKNILGSTNELAKALQRKDQDIVNAINLVKISKQRLQTMRDNGWEKLLQEVSLFCEKFDITVPQMDIAFIARGRARRNAEVMTNLHHYRNELFYTVIDLQLSVLNDRFDEVNSELLLCMSSLNPRNSFAAFNKQSLVRLAQFYPVDFSEFDLMMLPDQLETYILDVRGSDDFLEMNGIGDLAKKMVETKRDVVYPLVYLLITLSLILPVATATVERAFSAMHIVKNRLRNRMGDEWMNNCLITYIERDIFGSISNDVIIKRFQGMKTRRGQC